MKCPSSKAPASRNSRKTSSVVILRPRSFARFVSRNMPSRSFRHELPHMADLVGMRSLPPVERRLRRHDVLVDRDRLAAFADLPSERLFIRLRLFCLAEHLGENLVAEPGIE